MCIISQWCVVSHLNQQLDFSRTRIPNSSSEVELLSQQLLIGNDHLAMMIMAMCVTNYVEVRAMEPLKI